MKTNNNINITAKGNPIKNKLADFLIKSNIFLIKSVEYHNDKIDLLFNFRLFGSIPNKAEKVSVKYSINLSENNINQWKSLYEFIKAQSLTASVKRFIFNELNKNNPIIPIYEGEVSISNGSWNMDALVSEIIENDFTPRVIINKPKTSTSKRFSSFLMTHWIITTMIIIDSITTSIWFTVAQEWNVNIWGVIGLAVFYTSGAIIWYFCVMLTVVIARLQSARYLKWISIDIKQEIYKLIVDVEEHPELTVESYPLLVDAITINSDLYVLGAIYKTIPDNYGTPLNLNPYTWK